MRLAVLFQTYILNGLVGCIENKKIWGHRTSGHSVFFQILRLDMRSMKFLI